MGAEAPKPGWYDDPQATGRQRWWDGSAWTGSVRVVPPAVAAPVPVASATGDRPADPAPLTAGNQRGSRTVLLVSAVLVALIGAGAGIVWSLGGSDADDPEPAATDEADVTTDIEPVAEAPDDDPGPDDEPAPAAESDAAAPPGSFVGPPTRGQPGPLQAGFMMPWTGPFASLEPAVAAGLGAAAADIDAAGGVLGASMRGTTVDDAGDEQIALASAQELLDEGVQVVVGPLTSNLTRALAPLITGRAVMQCSGGATAIDLTGDRFDGYFLRTVPSDVLQADAIAELVTDSGARRVAVIRRDGDYERGLTDRLELALERSAARVERIIVIDDDETVAADALDAIATQDDATVLFTFDEGASAIDGLLQRGVSPERLFTTDQLQFALPAGLDDVDAADGITLVAPARGDAAAFGDRFGALLEFGSSLDPTEALLAAATYDCLVLLALAAEAAGSTDPTDIRNYLPFVTGGSAPCAGYEHCAELLRDEIATDYRSVTGDRLALNDRNQPDSARIAVRRLRGAQWVEETELIVEDPS